MPDVLAQSGDVFTLLLLPWLPLLQSK